MGEDETAFRVIVAMSSLFDSTSVKWEHFGICFEGMSVSHNIELLESYCLYGISLLETENGQGLFNQNNVLTPLLARLHSLSPDTFLRVKNKHLRSVMRQKNLRLQYYHSTQEIIGSETQENSLGTWLQDFGAPQWIAFTPDSSFRKWLDRSNGMLALEVDS